MRGFGISGWKEFPLPTAQLDVGAEAEGHAPDTSDLWQWSTLYDIYLGI